MNNLNYFLRNLTKINYFFKEIKFKLIYSLISIIITSIVCYNFINQLIYLITAYLLHNMNSHRFIFNELTEVFFTYLKFSIILGFFFTLPFIIFNF